MSDQLAEAEKLNALWDGIQSGEVKAKSDNSFLPTLSFLTQTELKTPAPGDEFTSALRLRLIRARQKTGHSYPLGIAGTFPAAPVSRSGWIASSIFVIVLALLVAWVLTTGLDMFDGQSGGISLATIQAETIHVTQTAVAGEITATAHIDP